jgi:hypothetical protein
MFGGGDRRLTPRARLRDRRLHRQEQSLELLGPGLVILLLHKRQLAQMVDVTEGMATLRVGAIGPPAVVHAHTLIAGQDADGVGRLTAALGVDGVVRDTRFARHVRPRQLARSTDPRLVAVQHRRALQRRFDLALHRPLRLGSLLYGSA